MISGFNCIQDPAIMEQRLQDVKRHILQLPPETIVFFEDAGYHVPAISARVREEMIKIANVFSMNEEEMQSYLGRSVDLLSDKEMFVALLEIRRLIPAETLVIHTKYWSIALGHKALDYRDALQGGITMASTRYSFGDIMTRANYEEVSRLPCNPVGSTFSQRITVLLGSGALCLPAFDLKVDAPVTIGLGDSFVGGFIAALAMR